MNNILNDVLLTDDEKAVLESLSAALDWSEYGFARVHMACSAEEALNILKNHPVSLLILDIQMPRMTGLEMLKTVRAKYPDTHCVLISAYSKFEYAKEALQLNVENYLLKPIDVNELRETVIRTAENIRRAASSSHNLFERNLLERWLYGRITGDELLEHSQYTRYNVLLKYYYAVAVRPDGDTAAALRSLTGALPRDSAVYTLTAEDGTGILLFGGHDISDLFVEEAASSVTAGHPKTRIICGSRATGSGDVGRSLTDALHSLEYARLAGYTGFLSHERIDWELLPSDLLPELNDLLRLEPFEARIRRFVSHFTNPSCQSANDFRGLYAQICLKLTQLSEKEGVKYTFPPLSASCTKDQFGDILTETLLTFCNENRSRTQDLTPIVRRVIRYINDNLSSTISIRNFCEQTNMNPTYIGRLFREESGMYFSEYVCDLRIRKAKLLLENTSYSVGDIARQVGMYDVSYFVQCFKKKEQISPMKYRQAISEKK